QHRVGAGDLGGELRHPPGAARDIARRQKALDSRLLVFEPRRDGRGLGVVGRMIADKDPHRLPLPVFAGGSLYFYSDRSQRRGRRRGWRRVVTGHILPTSTAKGDIWRRWPTKMGLGLALSV